jgi:hypothetical protein
MSTSFPVQSACTRCTSRRSRTKDGIAVDSGARLVEVPYRLGAQYMADPLVGVELSPEVEDCRIAVAKCEWLQSVFGWYHRGAVSS